MTRIGVAVFCLSVPACAARTPPPPVRVDAPMFFINETLPDTAQLCLRLARFSYLDAPSSCIDIGYLRRLLRGRVEARYEGSR